jgi:hypothetical protein
VKNSVEEGSDSNTSLYLNRGQTPFLNKAFLINVYFNENESILKLGTSLLAYRRKIYYNNRNTLY